MGQNSLQSKQIYITRLVEQAGINVNMLKLLKNGAVKLDFYKMQSNLNQILLGQYVMKNGLNLNKDDLNDFENEAVPPSTKKAPNMVLKKFKNWI